MQETGSLSLIIYRVIHAVTVLPETIQHVKPFILQILTLAALLNIFVCQNSMLTVEYFILPDEISFEAGTFIEPLACVVRGQRNAGLKPGQTVLVLGSGLSGLLHIALAKALGAGRIIATDINQFRMDAAKKIGADEVLDAKDDIPGRVNELNHGRPADLVIVCAGATSAFDQALQSVDRGGTILFFAPTEPGVNLSVPVNDFWRNSITLMPSYGGSPEDISVAIDLLRGNRIPVDEMITHKLGLEEAGSAFKLVANASECIKVILKPHG